LMSASRRRLALSGYGGMLPFLCVRALVSRDVNPAWDLPPPPAPSNPKTSTVEAARSVEQLSRAPTSERCCVRQCRCGEFD
jgi:hypothetical protein